jgi:Transposase DDE domain group 1
VGEKESEPFQFTFNGFLKVAFQGSRVTSDAGLVLVRELDERLGLEAIIVAHLSDSRHGLNTQFPLPDLLRQSVYSRLAGYEDLNDAERLSTDPTFRVIGSPKRWDRSAALTSTLHWFETELLTREENLVGLMAVNRELIGQAETLDHTDRVVLDMDSSESPVHGQQEGSAYNGHFETVCYHPLFLFNGHGDCVAAKLRPGNVSSADDWEELLVPEIDRQQAEHQRVAFRADAAFARPAIYEALEARGVQYAIRIPANNNLELAVEDILFRSPGRPSLKPLIRYKSFQYQADSWTTPRRVVAKVEHHAGELFPRVGFIVTNLPLPNRAVVRFYNKRGTAEQWIKEGKQAAHWTRLSCHRFRANEVRLQLVRPSSLSPSGVSVAVRACCCSQWRGSPGKASRFGESSSRQRRMRSARSGALFQSAGCIEMYCAMRTRASEWLGRTPWASSELKTRRSPGSRSTLTIVSPVVSGCIGSRSAGCVSTHSSKLEKSSGTH